jgi:hypothetical protein
MSAAALQTYTLVSPVAVHVKCTGSSVTPAVYQGPEHLVLPAETRARAGRRRSARSCARSGAWSAKRRSRSSSARACWSRRRPRSRSATSCACWASRRSLTRPRSRRKSGRRWPSASRRAPARPLHASLCQPQESRALVTAVLVRGKAPPHVIAPPRCCAVPAGGANHMSFPSAPAPPKCLAKQRG